VENKLREECGKKSEKLKKVEIVVEQKLKKC